MGKFSNFGFSQNYRFYLVVNQCLAQSGPAHCAGTVTVLAQWSKFLAQSSTVPQKPGPAQFSTVWSSTVDNTGPDPWGRPKNQKNQKFSYFSHRYGP